MPNLNIAIQPQSKQRPTGRTFVIELDAEKFEKLAGDFGFFNPEFLKSMEKSERQYRQGKAKTLKSLGNFRK